MVKTPMAGRYIDVRLCKCLRARIALKRLLFALLVPTETSPADRPRYYFGDRRIHVIHMLIRTPIRMPSDRLIREIREHEWRFRPLEGYTTKSRPGG